MDAKKYPSKYVVHILTFPFMYILLIPLIILDIFTELYHRICFPVYNIHYIKRSKYIKIDRHKLKYLNMFEKINCVFCGYSNGLINYVSVIGAKTERYWCGIQHQKSKSFIPPIYHKNFLKYNDKKTFKEKYK